MKAIFWPLRILRMGSAEFGDILRFFRYFRTFQQTPEPPFFQGFPTGVFVRGENLNN